MNPAWPHGDPRAVVRAILADGRFRSAAPVRPSRPSWLDVLWSRFTTFARALLHGLDHVLGAHNPLETAIGFAVAAAAAGLLAFGTYRLVRRSARGARRTTATEAAALGVENEPRSETLRCAALAAAREGRYREAAALLFRSATRALDERGRVAFDPARTPGEYRRLVRDAAFDELAAAAVVALFAPAEPRGDLFERMSGAYERFFDAPAR